LTLKTTETPENRPIGVRASAPKKVAGPVAHLKCVCTNAHSMGNKKEELEVIMQLENYGIVAITETWWDESHNWSGMSIAIDSYKHSRRDRRWWGSPVC